MDTSRRSECLPPAQTTIREFRAVEEMVQQASAHHADDMHALRNLQHTRMAALQQQFERQLADMAAEFSECVLQISSHFWCKPAWWSPSSVRPSDTGFQTPISFCRCAAAGRQQRTGKPTSATGLLWQSRWLHWMSIKQRRGELEKLHWPHGRRPLSMRTSRIRQCCGA